MDQNKIECLKARLDAVSESSKRSRLAFIFSTVASLAFLIGLYNAYFSWTRGFATATSFSENEITKALQKTLLEEWVKNQTIAVNFLGIRVGISDAALLSAMSLPIIVTWLFFCIRRENHITGSLLQDFQCVDHDTMAFVFHGVSTQMLFLDVTGSDEPIDSLSSAPSTKNGTVVGVRFLIKALYFLPCITIAACIISDWLTLFLIDATYRFPHAPLFNMLRPCDWAWVVPVELVATGACIVNGLLAFKIVKFEECTQSIMRAYYELLKKNTQGPRPAAAG